MLRCRACRGLVDRRSQLDPYFPFETAVEQWGRSFAALGISYEGASMSLDLLDRKGKYSNGFCHWPQCAQPSRAARAHGGWRARTQSNAVRSADQFVLAATTVCSGCLTSAHRARRPAWVKPDGTWQPTVTHFTSLADPSSIGSGHTALTTLMHEAGHAAHFANIRQPSPLFSQERAPTSVAYAELQSMFLDALVGDAAWRRKYARTREGEALPWALHEEDVNAKYTAGTDPNAARCAHWRSLTDRWGVPACRLPAATPQAPVRGAHAARHARRAVL
jgi:hypothetical protein